MTFDKINLAISTIWREENYLDATLRSLSREYPISRERSVSLVVGSPVTLHLDHLRPMPGITVVEMGPTVWSWIKNNAVRHRATWNYYRCLNEPIGGKRGTLLLEDDIRFAHGWQARLLDTLSVLEDRYGDNFAVSLYCPQSFALAGCAHGELFVSYPYDKFYGTQAMYYTAKMRHGFRTYLRKHGLARNDAPYDILLRYYLTQEGLPLFATSPSLVQHMGKQSTGLGGWYESPSFMEDVTALPASLTTLK
ncbi:hypothetical protein CCAX7_28680 [Capsulimonas corticalis]|uniref:Uncharacterized protein n=1 Tax=Capsulimonas corticalis TaxID=2219043 RepID=A0A402CT78_9BACT|nr:hypothetical protein [Capsulimonas corticalis]BDI30817.1 hypothetical protein CCAX7_28680 [Capsulimonas corticalis]